MRVCCGGGGGGGLSFRLITYVEIIKPSVCPVTARACENIYRNLSFCLVLFSYLRTLLLLFIYCRFRISSSLLLISELVALPTRIFYCFILGCSFTSREQGQKLTISGQNFH